MVGRSVSWSIKKTFLTKWTTRPTEFLTLKLDRFKAHTDHYVELLWWTGARWSLTGRWRQERLVGGLAKIQNTPGGKNEGRSRQVRSGAFPRRGRYHMTNPWPFCGREGSTSWSFIADLSTWHCLTSYMRVQAEEFSVPCPCPAPLHYRSDHFCLDIDLFNIPKERNCLQH